MNATDDNHDELPRAVIERLEARDRGVPLITPRVDAAISRQAAEHFARRGTRRASAYRRWALPAAVAATIVLVILITQPVNESSQDSPLLADDVDRSGRVDVLDAFALSRLRAASPADVDQRDIDRLMARIVTLRSAGDTL